MIFIKLLLISILLNQALLAKNCKNNWHKSHLLNSDGSYYIPYQLWMGIDWDKLKQIPQKRINQSVKGYGKRGSIIEGPFDWFHPVLQKNIQVYKRERKTKKQYFVFNEAGIGRVFDYRKNKKNRIRYYDGTNAKFPAGDDWKVNQPRMTEHISWKMRDMCLKNEKREHTVNIEKISFDECGNLKSLVSTFSINSKLDHRYWFEPKKGMVKSQKLSQDKK